MQLCNFLHTKAQPGGKNTVIGLGKFQNCFHNNTNLGETTRNNVYCLKCRCWHSSISALNCDLQKYSTVMLYKLSVIDSSVGFNESSARMYRPSFHENKPKTLVFSHTKRPFWACFHENWVYNFGHRYDINGAIYNWGKGGLVYGQNYSCIFFSFRRWFRKKPAEGRDTTT